MQTLLTDLFPWLVGLYLLDGVAIVRPFERLFVSRWGGAFSVLGPGLHWISIGPSAQVIACAPPPFFVSAEAVHLLPRARKEEPVVFAPDDLEAVPFAALGKLERVHRAIASPALKLKAPTPGVASQWAHHLARVAKAPAPERVQVHLASFGAAEAEFREVHGRALPWLRAAQVASTAMTVLLFTVLPLAIHFPKAQIDLTRVLATAAGLDAATLIFGGIALWRARVKAGEISSTLLMLALLPIQVMRAPAHLARQAFVRFDVVSLSRALLSDLALAALSEREQQRLRFSAARVPAIAACLEGLAKAWGRASRRSPPAPVRIGDDAAWYCPICTAQYQARARQCSDCDVPLAELDPRAHRRAQAS